MKVSRNDPCHCGSGSKYKNCHMRTDDSARRSEEAQARVAAGGATATVLPDAAFETRPLSALGKGMGALGVVVAGAIAAFSGIGDGLIVAAAWALAYIAWLSFRSPPPPNVVQGNGAALDFGMSADTKKSGKKKR